MRLIPSDPDVATIMARIKDGDINLQPDFQRGEVWSLSKKQRLIDSILRDWHVPPIHVIELKTTNKQEVLDGQQRLASIRDFVNGEFRVDGKIEPITEEIASLDGLTYSRLPPERRRKFDQFTLRFFRITDYEPEEPSELFFRLNQPVSLTPAEQRNAFYGPARQQVKDLVILLTNSGIEKASIGFSNSRMAYDDVLARLCHAIEHRSIREKITATMLADKYRSRVPFGSHVIEQVEKAIELWAASHSYITTPTKLTRATLFSWLWFVVERQKADSPQLTPTTFGGFISFFEALRASIHDDYPQQTLNQLHKPLIPFAVSAQFIRVYEDRSSSHVTDVLSVLSRDLVLWVLFGSYSYDISKADHLDQRLESVLNPVLNLLHETVGAQKRFSAETAIDVILRSESWGQAK